MNLSLGSYEDAVRARTALLDPELRRIWDRDASLWGGDAARHASVANRLGWLDVVATMQGRSAELEEFAAESRDAGFSDAVVLGMGGSSLAPEVLRHSITDQLSLGGAPRLHIVDTTDPATIARVTKELDVARTVFFVSSKSGTTIEALCLFAYFHEIVQKVKGDTAGENFVAITDDETPLKDLAKRHAFRRVFVNATDIGGRYSALSYFGLVPSAVAGLDVRAILATANDAVVAADAAGNDGLRLGAALGELALAGRDKCTFLLSPGIASFGLWVEQLIAESTGKAGTGILPIVGEPLLDPPRYGPDRSFVYVRLDGDDNIPTDRAMAEVAKAGHPVVRIDLQDRYDLGREFFNWEFAVAILGLVLGINPFDEPNVQESKDNTGRVLADMEATGHIALDSVGVESRDLPGALATFCGALHSAGYLAITSYTPDSSVSNDEFSRMRQAVSERYGIATTLGYGPRFLHSTGQFHKGGPQVGAFLQVVGEPILGSDQLSDVAIPNKGYTFGQLKRAQAAGDRRSLLSRGRPVVTVDVGADPEHLGMLRGALEQAMNGG